MIDMANINNWYGMSDPAILKEIGQKLKAYRLQKNITQEEMAQKAGVNRVTIGEIEKGRPSSLLTFIQILRGLNMLDLLNNITPVPTVSPIQMAKIQRKSRQRASTPHPAQPANKSTW
jgi:DNA-binding XRE family transcriptional regulator